MKKRYIFIGLFILLSFLFLVFFLYYGKIELTYKEEVTYWLHEEVSLYELVKVKRGNIVNEDYMLDTSKVDVYKISFRVRHLWREKDYEMKVNIIDTEAPKIEYEKNLSTALGIEIDLLENVHVTDNSGEDIIIHIEGTYDFNKVGVYTLTYVARDSSGNETRETFLLEVMNKPIQNNKPIQEKPVQADPVEDVTFTTSKGFQGVIKEGVTYVEGILIVNKTYALPSTYGSGLDKEVLAHFEEMKGAATLEGLHVYLSSGFRSFATQEKLYTNYVLRDGVEKADTYSARAGHSEHQSGLAFDVNQINDTFHDSPEAIWLSNHCYQYGFILRYPKGKTNETGYKYESWHFRYVGVDLATKLYNNGDWITLEDYFGLTSIYNS